MPNVPMYDGFTVAPPGGVGGQFAAPRFEGEAGQLAQQGGEGMARLGGVATRAAVEMADKANAARVDESMNAAIRKLDGYQVEALKLQGKNALEPIDGKSLADHYDEQVGKDIEDISAGLGNDDQRRMFTHAVAAQRRQLYGTITAHQARQQEVYQKQVWGDTITTANNRKAMLWGDAAAVQQSDDAIAHTIDQQAAAEGWDAETKAAKLAEARTTGDVATMQAMIAQGYASKAKEYYETHSAGMTLQGRAQMQDVIKNASDGERAEAGADAVWAKLGPRGANDPVRIFDMEQAARAALKDNPDAMRSAIAGLRERAAAFNAQQAETKANTTNAVWAMVDQGGTLAQIERSPAFLAMDGAKQHEMRRAILAEREQDSARVLTDARRGDELALMKNGADYLTASDPNVLRTMTRAQVEAKRGDFGMEATQQLLQKWDAIQKPEKLAEARMDTEDFNKIADDMGLHPYAAQGEDKKRALGTLKQRVENLIDLQQRDLKRPLDRQEKQDLMRKEMARTVTLSGWFGDSQKPVIQLGKDDLKDVVVPAAERQKIADALWRHYQREPNNPAYTPNDANIRRLYLMGQGPAGREALDGR